MTRRSALALALIASLAAVWYLRDPPWLASLESGFRRWEQDRDGTAYRWIGGHASFFVPSDSAELTVPVRAPGAPDDPAVVSISVDDRLADRVTLADGEWHRIRIRLHGDASRRVRRIDIRVNRTLADNRGLQVGRW